MNRFSSGFTLIELIVAIGIFGLLATLSVANIRGGSTQQEVRLQADSLSALLREAQVRSLSGTPFEGNFPVGGYGVHLETCSTPPCSPVLFADSNANFAYDGASEAVETLSLGTSVTLDTISTGSPSDIVFKPPRPYICVSAECSGVGEVVITLETVEGNRTAQVTVNQISGQISS